MSPADNLDVFIDAPGWSAGLADVERLCEAAVDAALAVAPTELRDAEVSVLLSDDATMCRLNRTYRGHDAPTNVLSFEHLASPASPSAAEAGRPRFLGDIALGWELVASEARAAGKPLADHFRHLVVHGMLHLLGYDHQNDADADVMERLEARLLEGLGVPDPYPPPPDVAPSGLTAPELP